MSGGTTVTLTWPATGQITQEFGWTDYARSGAYGGKPHTGIDIGVPIGTPVRAAGSGRVTTAGWGGGYGNWVVIDHGAGVETIYGHLSSIAVTPGQTVTMGQLIGYSGNTGYSTGPHLHFEIRINGEPVDPLRVIGPMYAQAFGVGGGWRAVDRARPYSEDEVEQLVANGVRAAFVYIGGRNNGGRAWQPEHADLLRDRGLLVEGIYVGENRCRGCWEPDWSRGKQDAEDAYNAAQRFHVGRVFLDVEADTWYRGGQGVKRYIRDFIETLLQTTVEPGVYGPPSLCSWLREQESLLVPVWVASWVPNPPERPPFGPYCAWQWTNCGILGSDESIVWHPSYRDPVTGRTVGGGFLEYWLWLCRRLGWRDALMLIGRPVTDERREKETVVQYFERARFEWHPGKRPERWDVLLGRVAAELLACREGGR